MADSLLIRRAGSADLAGLVAVDAESFDAPWTEAMHADGLASAVSRVLAAETATGEFVGYVAAWLVIDELQVLNVAVRRAWRRRGVAARLVRRLLDDARAEGAVTAWLDVRAGNTGARRLYEGLGFVATGVRKDYYHAPPEDAILMTLQIQALGGDSGA